MLYTFLGPDLYAKQLRLQALSLDQPLRLDGTDGVLPWTAAIGQGDLFGQARAVVGRDLLDGLSTADRKQLATVLEAAVSPDFDQTVVVLEPGTELSAKDSLAQVLAKGTIERFPLPSQGQVVRWIEQELSRLGMELPKPLIVDLAERFGTNRLALSSELTKLWLLRSAGRQASLDIVVGADQPIEAFGLVEAWLQRKADVAMMKSRQLIQQRQSVQALLGLLEWQARLLYICLLAEARGEDSSRWASALQFKPFAVNKTLKAVKRWQLSQAEWALTGLFELDLGIKSGKIEPELGLELWLVESLG